MRLTSADSTNAVHNVVVDRLIFVHNVYCEDNADAELGELFADGDGRRLAKAVYMRRRYDDSARPLHNQ